MANDGREGGACRLAGKPVQDVRDQFKLDLASHQAAGLDWIWRSVIGYRRTRDQNILVSVEYVHTGLARRATVGIESIADTKWPGRQVEYISSSFCVNTGLFHVT